MLFGFSALPPTQWDYITWSLKEWRDLLRFRTFLFFLEAKFTYIHMKEGIQVFKIHHWQCIRSSTASTTVTPRFLNLVSTYAFAVYIHSANGVCWGMI